MFATGGPWSQLDQLAGSEANGSLYKAAATYLEKTHPSEYDKELVLASIAAIIGSSTDPQNSAVPPVVLTYLSDFAQEVFGRLNGNDQVDRTPRKTVRGSIADFSTYGCFEIRRLVAEDPNEFNLRVGVRTMYAEDSVCLKGRPQQPQ
jgi:hypothetical protein